MASTSRQKASQGPRPEISARCTEVTLLRLGPRRQRRQAKLQFSDRWPPVALLMADERFTASLAEAFPHHRVRVEPRLPSGPFVTEEAANQRHRSLPSNSPPTIPALGIPEKRCLATRQSLPVVGGRRISGLGKRAISAVQCCCSAAAVPPAAARDFRRPRARPEAGFAGLQDPGRAGPTHCQVEPAASVRRGRTRPS